ncbi:MAG: FxsA family protein [Verrucomicrobiota bacterium]|nr:FxsA family protein [Verrucomicrobiota bacterium]MEC8517239.1 FxsA family protein [Verrucomicrobiota bacterium]MEC8753210.1 FxsA family protein [Verrucomicrobiota bacterium]|tara:strand:- start:1425 stop:1817 length:393 start_codon:yes stop_codon:yes gene_type:complete
MSLNKLLLIFITLPILELAVLLRLDDAIGLFQTIVLIFLTGIIGAWLVRQQGISIIFKIKKEISDGNMPAKEMIDGVMVLIAGAVLVTPGLITDIFGFLLLIPYTRNFIRKWIRHRIEKYVNSGYIITRY